MKLRTKTLFILKSKYLHISIHLFSLSLSLSLSLTHTFIIDVTCAEEEVITRPIKSSLFLQSGQYNQNETKLVRKISRWQPGKSCLITIHTTLNRY